MRLTRIEITDWMAYEGAQGIDLPGGPIAVVARYTSDPRRSNWAGKTALFDAIGWALFNVHRKRLDDGVIRNGKDRVVVELFLGAGLGRCDDHIRIKRTRVRGRGMTLQLSMPVFNSQENEVQEMVYEGEVAQSEIERLLCMKADDLEATTWFKQGDVEAIVGLTSGKRRSTLVRWLELEAWERASTLAKAAVAESAAKLMTLSAQSVELSNGALDAATLLALGQERASLEAREAEIAALRDVSEAKAVLLRARTRDGHAAVVSERAEAARSARAALQNMSTPDVDLEALRVKHAETVRKSAAISEDLDRAKSVRAGNFDGVCPVVKTNCPSMKFVEQARTTSDARYRAAYAAMTEIEVIETKLGEEIRKATVASAAHTRAVDHYNSALESARAAKARLDACEGPTPAQIAKAEQTIATAEEAATEALSVSRRLGEIGSLFETNEARINRAAKVARLEAEAVEKHSTDVLVARAFAPTGIPARIAAEQLLALEERSNALLEGSGLSFSFSWERTLADLASICEDCGHTFKGQRDKSCPKCEAPRGYRRSDELDILVDDDSHEVEDVRQKSGGAKVMVASAIRLSGGAMLRALRGSPVTWAIVDEPFGFLDAVNRESLVKTFTMLSASGLDQAFIVSHDAALLDGLPTKIVIVRDGDASYLTIEGAENAG